MTPKTKQIPNQHTNIYVDIKRNAISEIGPCHNKKIKKYIYAMFR